MLGEALYFSFLRRAGALFEKAPALSFSGGLPLGLFPGFLLQQALALGLFGSLEFGLSPFALFLQPQLLRLEFLLTLLFGFFPRALGFLPLALLLF